MNFSIKSAAQRAKNAARVVAKLGDLDKKKVLIDIANQILTQSSQIQSANQKDLAEGVNNGLSAAMLDRLKLNQSSLEALSKAVIQIANQTDPVGKISNMQRLPSGIEVGKMRIPLGVIAMIYESRPNVTIDAAALCFKAGNAVILRGGKEAIHSNMALAECIKVALQKHHIPEAAVTLIPDPDRAIVTELLTLDSDIDLVIPRGGESLIRYVSQHSRIPVIQHYKGVCHLYVTAAADQSKALSILENGKTQRTGVCNALETLLVDDEIKDSFLPKTAQLFSTHQVEIHACPISIGYFHAAQPATQGDWYAEYLAPEIAIRVVSGMDQAVEHIEQYGSGHTDVIVTQDYSQARHFIRSIDSSVVMVNASSRFSDGGELGLGSEIGISTSKLHAYGPMGVEQLTTEKFIVFGEGHVRA